MDCTDDLLHEIAQLRIANNSTPNKHAVARLRPQQIFETLEAALGRRVDDFVPIPRISHPLPKIGQSLRDLRPIL
jgi:hypothetical protein